MNHILYFTSIWIFSLDFIKKKEYLKKFFSQIIQLVFNGIIYEHNGSKEIRILYRAKSEIVLFLFFQVTLLNNLCY